MLLLAVLAAVAVPSEPPSRTVRPNVERQARATVRIVNGEHVRFADIEKQRPQALRSATLRTPQGEARAARLLEFE